LASRTALQFSGPSDLKLLRHILLRLHLGHRVRVGNQYKF
jgi:hypothetical protein